METVKYPFIGVEHEDAKRLVGRYLRKDHEVVRKFYEGDHWQEGNGWIGPKPKMTDEGYADVMAEITRAFTSRNTIYEVVRRHASGIMGREPRWELTPRRMMAQDEEPTKEEKRLIDEAEAFLTEWWDKRNVAEKMEDYVATALWANAATARLYVPQGLLTDATLGDGRRTKAIRAASMEEALDLVHLMHPDPQQSAVYTDPDTMRQLGIYLWKDENDEDHMELAWVDPLGMTILQVDEGYFPLNYGGRIPMYMMQHPGLINDAVLQNQRALNLALSITPRNVVTGGFLERVLLNAQMPGDWEYDEAGNRIKFIPEPYITGSGTTNFVRGIDYTDEDGKTHITNPSVNWRDPIDVKPAIEAKDAHYLNILDEVEQAHILTTSSQFQSGKSKEQARAGFMASINTTRKRADACGRWTLETALAMAEQFSGQPGLYTSKLRAVFNSRPDYGPLAADERREYTEAMEKGVMSRERVMYLSGIDDVDAEIAKINTEKLSTMEMVKKLLEVIGSANTAGVGAEAAVKMLGLDEETAALVMKGVEQMEAKRKEEQDAENSRRAQDAAGPKVSKVQKDS